MSKEKKLQNVLFEGVRIGYTNFKGEPTRVNPKGGTIDFVIFISDLDFADQLSKDGWNIKFPKPNPDIAPEDDTRLPYLPVEVSYRNYPPRIVLITSNGHQNLDENSIGILQAVRYANIDVIVSPYTWSGAFGSGVKAYCRELYVTATDEGLATKYGF